LTIINDILDFSKIEAGRMELEQQPFDVRDCVESALDLVVTKARDKGIELAYFIDAQTPAMLIGDVTRLRQILINLLGNALKFTDKGEVVVSIDPVRTEQHDDRTLHTLHFAVKDTGLGIPPERLDRLFRSFSQVDASTTRKYGGTGLGLAISKRLSELMGGTMWVESAGIPGQGSTFHFTLQATVAPTQARVYLHADQPQLRDRRVLIVDDNDTNRRVLMGQARSWNMLPRETSSPREALDWIRRGDPFDLALLDMQMPDMDGVMLAHEIRHYRDAQALPLIMLSSMGRKEVGAAEAQFAAYLTKPVKQSMLYDALVEVFTGQPDTAPRPEPAATPQFDAQLGERLPLRLLLAEDNAVNQKLALQMLRKMGYRADVAGNGLEVLDALERQPYDVVLMDVQMPELDGLEATRRIRAMTQAGRTQPRIIAMTANAMQGDREACLAAGMDDYVGKPIQVKELQAALERWGQDLRPIEPLAPAEPAAMIDWSMLNDLRGLQAEGEADFALEMIGLYLENAPQLIDTIRQSMMAGDAPVLQRSAHTLKGSSASLGAQRVATLCGDLEKLGREGTVAGGDVLLAEVEQEFDRVRTAFQAQLVAV
jgi:CheY-like chemotaxis protein/HPt (histidine-containing phosphotransfer) domain-containing protein